MVICCLLCFLAKAQNQSIEQECGYMSISSIDCESETSLPPCDVKEIRTDPYNPFNCEVPAKINRFNWIDPNPFLNTPFPEYCLNSWVLPQDYIQTPYSQGDNVPINHFLGKMDTPEDGWEIIKYDFGYTEEGVVGVPVDYPYLVLYNRFTAVLRVFIAVSEQQHPFNVAEVILNFIEGPVASTLDLSTAFSSNSEGVVSIEGFFENEVQFRSASSFLNGPGRWLYADFPMMYDPCACSHGSKLSLSLNLISSAEINLEGTATGTASPILDSSNGTYKDANGQYTWGWKEIAGFNEKALQKSVKSYKDMKGFTTSVKDAIERSGLSASDKAQKVDDVGKLANAAASLGFLKAGLTALPWITSAITFLDFFVTGGKEDTQQEVQIGPMGIEMNMRYKGNIDASTFRKNITFFTPGSNNYPLNTSSAIDYPLYNQALGVFNLLETPELKYTATPEQPADFLVIIDKESPVWSDWDPYQPNDHPALAQYQGQHIIVDPYNHDAFELFTDGYPYIHYRYKMEHPPAHAVNPATGFQGDSEVLAAIFIEAFELTENEEGNEVEVEAGLGFILGSDFNLLSEGKGLYRTHWIPLSCLEQIAVEFAAGLNTQVRVTLKVMGNFERGDIYANEQTQNVLHVWKFATKQILSSEPGYDWSTPFVNIPLNKFIGGTQVLTEDLYAWETVEIGADAELQAPISSPVSIIAGKDIIVSPDAKIAPNITLKIANHNGCTEEYKPSTIDFVDNFCNQKYDLTKRTMPESGFGPIEEEKGLLESSVNDQLASEVKLGKGIIDHEKLAMYQVDLYPNPVSSQASINIHLPEDGRIEAELRDSKGRRIRKVLPAAYLESGTNNFVFSTVELQPGVYALIVTTKQGPVTIRLVKQ